MSPEIFKSGFNIFNVSKIYLYTWRNEFCFLNWSSMYLHRKVLQSVEGRQDKQWWSPYKSIPFWAIFPMQQVVKIMFTTLLSMTLHIFIRIWLNSPGGFSVYGAAKSNWNMLAQVQVFHADRLLSIVQVWY